MSDLPSNPNGSSESGPPLSAPNAGAPARPSYARPASAAATAQADDTSLASIVDTIEAIIIALILALTFRAFIIEAFVIPTGSMAPTLLGAHFDVTCPECGYTFNRDASLHYQRRGNGLDYLASGELTSNTNVPCDGDNPASLVCPNCQYIIPYNLLPQYLGSARIVDPRDGRGGRDVPFAWANNGDRILVLKYIYSLLEPSRFDVIVFKEPMKAKDNFIKRLIGLPGETIEIIGGDIYVGPPGKTRAEDRLIARKPLYVQKAVWQLVYDNDYYPKDEGASSATDPYPRSNAAREAQLPSYFAEWHNPWTGIGASADSWDKPRAMTRDGKPLKTIGGPVITYRGKSAGALEFNAEHKDPYTYNVLGYNNDIQDLYNGHQGTLMPVGDLRVETTWTPAEESGESVSVSVGSTRNLFKVTWSKEGLELLKFDPGTQAFVSVEKLRGALPVPKAGQAFDIAMNNVDHSVQFFIDGKLWLQHDTLWTAADARRELDDVRKTVEAARGTLLDTLSPRVEVEVGGAATLAHLKLLRDLYYTQTEAFSGNHYPGAANTDYPLTLGPDEFFAMGDNSRRSHDGRSWNEVYPALDDLGTRRGVVPRRYLLGKAVFVYWPAGFRFTDSVPYVPPLVPNTGDMRFIR